MRVAAAAAVLPLLNWTADTELNEVLPRVKAEVPTTLPPPKKKIIYKTLRSILICLQKYLNILMSKWGQNEKLDRQGSPQRELKEAESASGGLAVCEGHVLEQLQVDKSSIFPSPSPSGCFCVPPWVKGAPPLPCRAEHQPHQDERRQPRPRRKSALLFSK